VISNHEPHYRLSDNKFNEAAVIIERSEAVAYIERLHLDTKGSGGQPRNGIEYSLTAVLVCTLTLLIIGRTPTYKSILNAIADMSDRQLIRVGMGGQDLRRIFSTPAEQRRERGRFIAWLDRLLKPLDSAPDQPARRITNAQHHRIIAQRSPQQRADYAAAAGHLRTVVNLIIKGSIVDRQPTGAVGDLVADETIYTLAGPSSGLGSKAHRNRGAAYAGKYYIREGTHGALSDGQQRQGKQITKHGFGIGVTTITRIGAGTSLHAVAPVIVAAEIHEPTSGDITATRRCLEQMKANGLDNRPPAAHAWPLFTVDMGYSNKIGFAELMLEHRYAAVFRYPENQSLFEASVHSTGPNPRPTGPIQFAGAFYCPAAAALLKGHRLPRTRDLLNTDRWREHDDRLRNVLPFLMGTNSRPHYAQRRGRPRLGQTPQQELKTELVCPAVQLRVQCPLKPQSMELARFGTPLAQPTWAAEDIVCCAQSSLTLTLTPAQVKKAQWRLVGASWEHILYLEAARSLNEQIFSVLKSPTVTGLTELKAGPRREPMLKLVIALAIAAANLCRQKSHHERGARAESIDIRMRQLTAELGREPARTPPRT